MSDSEYSSEDDEDYVPDPESGSEEDDFEGQEGPAVSKGKAPKKKQDTKRKRKGGIKLEDEENDEEEDEGEENQTDEEGERETESEERARIKCEEEEKAKKARMEDLWATFKNDTASVRAKPSNTLTCTKAAPSKAANTNPTSATDSKKEASSSKTPGKGPAAKVTITKTFDFAGEAVTVTKTVDADSAEAKASEKQQQQQQQKATNLPVNPNFHGTKRPGGLGSVLGQIGKKQKISTLEKSKLDWDRFKTETGIADELRNFNKNGYLEKQDFLQRADQRIFEKEKEARAAMRKQH